LRTQVKREENKVEDDSRETYQAKAIRMMKQYIREIDTLLSEYAGRSNKPQVRVDQINKLSEFIDKYLRSIAENRQWPSEIMELWVKFTETFQRGRGRSGSWTRSLEYVRRLDRYFQNIES
jgi:hypothetical protein